MLGLILIILLPRLWLCRLAFANPERFLRPDSAGYLILARNLWSHGAFSQSLVIPLVPDVLRVPGYPVFLGLWTTVLNLPLAWTIMIHCLVGALAAAFFGVWLQRTVSSRAAFWATAIFALDPVILFHTPLILTDIPFLLILVIAMIVTWKALQTSSAFHLTASGLLWGAASLVRPVSLYFPLLLAAVCIRPKKKIGLFLLAAYLLPFGWCVRNQRTADTFSFTTQGGIDLLKYSAPAIVAMDTHRTLQQAQEYLKNPIDAAHAPYASPFEQSRLYEQKAAQVILQHPFLFTRFCLYGAARILFGSGFEMFFETTGLPSNLAYPSYHPNVMGTSTLALLRLHAWMTPCYVAYMLLLLGLYGAFLSGVWKLRKTKRFLEGRFLLIGMLYFLGLSSIQGHYRFRISLMPFLLAGAAFAFSARAEKN